MTQFTLDDLRRILRAGAGDSGALDGDIADVPFADLGYDSLSLLELTSRVEREFHVSIPEFASMMQTPGAAVAYINDRLATSV